MIKKKKVVSSLNGVETPSQGNGLSLLGRCRLDSNIAINRDGGGGGLGAKAEESGARFSDVRLAGYEAGT